MSDRAHARDGVPEDYPGRVTAFPDGVTHLAISLVGIESDDAGAREAFADACPRLAALPDGPARLERGACRGAGGAEALVFMAYWSDVAASDRWWRSPAVSEWWEGLPSSGESAYWRERMQAPAERFNYAAGTEDRHGAAAVLPLEASAAFGYWGAYRDRLPASRDDAFESPLDAVPAPLAPATRGRRLRVEAPDNVCYIREGQGWGDCGEDERRIWDEDMNPVIDEWVGRLGGEPQATGCLVIRDCAERSAADGAAIDRRCQLAFLLSLGHIEQAARTDPAHLAVHGAFVKMYREPRFEPRMHVWVELAILKRGELDAEYVNCDPGTGLLRWFDAEQI